MAGSFQTRSFGFVFFSGKCF